MRNWYKKYLDKNKGRKSNFFYYLIIINVAIILFWFSKSRKENDLALKAKMELASPVIISSKLTTKAIDLTNIEKETLYENSEDFVHYLIETKLSNIGENGYVKIKAKLIREDTTLLSSQDIFLKKNDTIFTKIFFDKVNYKDLKRKYYLEISPIEKELVLK